MRKIDRIIIHCSDSTWGGAFDIDAWHKERGFGFERKPGYNQHIGYHYVIRNGRTSDGLYIPCVDGALEEGRPLWVDGAHALKYNKGSIGICRIGVDTFTEAQDLSLLILVRWLQVEFKIRTERVVGHCELDRKKPDCPGFDMERFRNMLG